MTRRVPILLACVIGCAHPLRGADPRVGVRLPRDHGAHGDAQTEWWHFHGHVEDARRRRYDWFLAFVRQHTDVDSVLGVPVRWFVDPFQVAYFSVLDRTTGRMTYREKHAFPDTWAADARAGALWLRHDSWRAFASRAGRMLMRARAGATSLEMRMRSVKPPTPMGSGGYVEVPPRSSHHYYTMPRLAAAGTIRVDGEERAVRGEAWFKHQWGFLYSDHIAGWTWFGTQLSNGIDLEIALIFDRGWDMAAGSYAVAVERDGTATRLDLRRIDLQETGETWRSPRTGTVYPTSWAIWIPQRNAALSLRAVAPDQEMVVFPANLWAGTLDATGTFDGEAVTGSCFAEIVGLDEPFGRDLVRTGRPD
ncbi:MAG: hypothetical protein HYY06_20880 [Deltaproteobacteria bacterium]|nr:hypothetical protein [Deltaproteobacteria bacterium]